MVASLLHPLNIFIVGLGGGFAIPILNRFGAFWVRAAFLFILLAMTTITAVAMARGLGGAEPIEILTGGAALPIAIHLRLGLAECVFALGVNVVALLGAVYFLRAKYAVLLLYLILVMGIQGMVMTRDLFNLFVFLEIVSIGTYGLLGLQDTPQALAAAFKYILATVLASSFLLLGTAFAYYTTGSLNIDDLIARRDELTGPFGFAALILLLAFLLLELKPFPANGWGLDVYETAKPEIAALVSVGASAGLFFALLKLLPLFEAQLPIIALSGGVTFVVSNVIGLVQGNARRLLGYSSIGQMGLMTLALALLQMMDAQAAMPLVIGGFFVNHLLAKAGLFWLAGFIGRERLEDWSLAGRPATIFVFGLLLLAIAGLPPFPGFWAKWHLVLTLAKAEHYVWIAVILVGSLLEAAYLFRWFGRSLHGEKQADNTQRSATDMFPVYGAALLLAVGGYYAALLAGMTASWTFLPLVAGFVLYLLDSWPGRVKCLLLLAMLLVGGLWLIHDLSGIGFLFAVLLYAGSCVLLIACLQRDDLRRGFFPLLAIMLLALPALPRAATSLEFLFIWEMVSLSAYFVIARERKAEPSAYLYLMFSLGATFVMLAGFASLYAANGSVSLSVLRMAGPDSNTALLLLAIGLLVKVAAIGVHIWLPAAHADADYEVSALLSGVITKASVFGLVTIAYLATRSEVSLEFAHVLGWIGMLTTLAGAIMALRQDDIKRMLAYSSMSQLGYIVTSVALLSHLGWVTAFYLAANHMMVKGILFLVAGAVILRTGSRLFSDLGGLACRMPFTFAVALVAIVSMSGLPPLAGFGGKWLLLSGMMEKGWYGPVVLGVIATFIGLLYMARFVYVIFFGARPAHLDAVQEAPLPLLVPQYLAAAGILIVSFLPKLFIEPLSHAIDPYFASTLRWDGMSLEMIYGYWNPMPTMLAALALSAIMFLTIWFLQRGHDKPGLRKPAGLDAFRKRATARLTPPLAIGFWNGMTAATLATAGRLRLVYTGNGQTYALYVLYYFLALYLASGGVRQFWAG